MTKKEKEDMKTSLSKIDNKFEMIAYIWTFGNKEIKSWIIIIQFAVILGLLIKFTSILDIFLDFIKRILGVA